MRDTHNRRVNSRRTHHPKKYERRQPRWRNFIVHGLLVIIIAEATYIGWLLV